MLSALPSTVTKVFLAAATIVAIAGVILFFPINFSDEHTCLLDHIAHAAVMASDPDATHTHPSKLLGQYLIPYGLFWWLSILVLVLAVTAWLRRPSKQLTQPPRLSTPQQERKAE